MKRFVRLALVLGALVGLFGQAMALAHGPARPASQETKMSDDCMQMMAREAPQKQQRTPCKGLTLDCIAAMGCSVPMILGEPFAIGPSSGLSTALHWGAPPGLLSGRSIPPDPDPPSLI